MSTSPTPRSTATPSRSIAGMHYALACVEVVRGNLDAAREHLARAVELRPEAAARARDDEDLRELAPEE